ncbi:patronin-like isoform X3, partial [Biomphalaria pfeifferi]
ICLETTCPVCKLTYNYQENRPLMLPNGVSVSWKCANEFPEKELLRFTKDVMIHDGTSGLFYNTAFLKLIERLQQNF